METICADHTSALFFLKQHDQVTSIDKWQEFNRVEGSFFVKIVHWSPYSENSTDYEVSENILMQDMWFFSAKQSTSYKKKQV